MTPDGAPTLAGPDHGLALDPATPETLAAPGARTNPGAAGGVTRFEVAPEGRSWLIRHNQGVLGRVAHRDEAMQIATELAAWCKSQGRLVSFRAE
ncbi:MAG: hypothetical protein Q8M47_02395 [Devosia sp.]|nr:hypothetical protein [Devosia sp.]